MKTRDLTLVLLCGLFAVSRVQAAGVSVRWDKCFGDEGVPNKAFACNSNQGAHQLVLSFVMPALRSGVDGVRVDLDLSTASPTVPAWWDMRNSGGCRGLNSLVMNTVLDPAAVACEDWTSGMAASSIGAYTIGTLGPNTASFWGAATVPFAWVATLLPGQEYFAGNILVENQKTVGDGSCSGCIVPVCIALESVSVGVNAPTVLTQPANGGNSSFVTWQGGAGVGPPPGGACPLVVPTRNATWSLVKSLYR